MDEVKMLRAKIAQLERHVAMLHGQIHGLADLMKAQYAGNLSATQMMDELQEKAGALAPAIAISKAIARASTAGPATLRDLLKARRRDPHYRGRRAIFRHVADVKLWDADPTDDS